MARANWVKGSTTTGGTGSLTLASVTGFPTFAQAFGTGDTTVSYVIESNGLREAGTANFNGTSNILSSRSVIQSWNGTTFGTAAQNFPTSGVTVKCAPVSQEVAYTDPTTGILATAHVPAFTGHVTNSAGSLALTIAPSVITDAHVVAGSLSLDAFQSSVFPPASHTHPLTDLSNFAVTSPTSGQFMKYNGTSWVNVTANLADFGDVDEIAGTDGDFLQFVTTQWTVRSPAQVKATLGVPTNSTKAALAFGYGAPTNSTYTLSRYMPFAGTVDTLHYESRSGTVTAAVSIQGVDVTGLTALSVSSTPASANASAANSFSVGQRIQITFSAGSSPVDVAGTLLLTRTTS